MPPQPPSTARLPTARKTFLVGIDGSELSMRALRLTSALADDMKDNVVIGVPASAACLRDAAGLNGNDTRTTAAPSCVSFLPCGSAVCGGFAQCTLVR